MKGIIFNELQDVVVKLLGADAWERVLEETQLKTTGGGFVGPQTYPDEDLAALVVTVSRISGMPVDELIRVFGRELFPSLVRVGEASEVGRARSEVGGLRVGSAMRRVAVAIESEARIPREGQGSAPARRVARCIVMGPHAAAGGARGLRRAARSFRTDAGSVTMARGVTRPAQWGQTRTSTSKVLRSNVAQSRRDDCA
jgi:hypothetical protein